MLRKILIKIYRLSLVKSASLLLCINLASIILFGIFSAIFDIDVNGDVERIAGESFLYDLLLLCVVAPLLETYIFQWLIYNMFESQFRKKLFLCCLLGGCIFGIVHLTSLMYIVVASFTGFLFLLWYALFARKYNNFTAFCTIAIVHALSNSFPLFLNYFAYYW